MEPEPLSPEAQAASQAAVHAAKNAAQAVEMARAAQMQAHDEVTTQALVKALEQVFGEQEERQRFIDTKRIPLICKDITDIKQNISDIKDMMAQVKSDLIEKDEKNEDKYLTKEQFSPYKWVLTIAGGVVVTSLVAAVLAQVLIK